MKKYAVLLFAVMLALSSCTPSSDVSTSQQPEFRTSADGSVVSIGSEPTDGSGQSELSFFDQTAYTDEQLKEMSKNWDYTNISDEYDFEMFKLDPKIKGVQGFCAIGEQLYITDYQSERIHVLDNKFVVTDTIRDGSDAEPWFLPRGLCKDKDGNLVVITDVNNLTDNGHILSYNKSFEVIKDTTFTLKSADIHFMSNDVAVLDYGDVFFTVKSEINSDGKIYKVNSDGSVDGVGESIFGTLCPSIAGDEVMFLNSFFGIDNKRVTRNGQSALFRIGDGLVKGITKIPSEVFLLPSDDEIAEVVGMKDKDGNAISESDAKSFRHQIYALRGYADLEKVGNEYFVLAENKPAIFVFDEKMEYVKTIKIPVNDEWNMAKYLQNIWNHGPMAGSLYLDSDENGILYIVCRIYGESGNYYIGVRATKKAG